MTPAPHHYSALRTYRLIAPLLVWRIRRCWKLGRWAWQCRLCRKESNGESGRGNANRLTWEEALDAGLEHMIWAHGCPSMRASGEPCTDSCTDCGGRMWIR